MVHRADVRGHFELSKFGVSPSEVPVCIMPRTVRGPGTFKRSGLPPVNAPAAAGSCLPRISGARTLLLKASSQGTFSMRRSWWGPPSSILITPLASLSVPGPIHSVNGPFRTAPGLGTYAV